MGTCEPERSGDSWSASLSCNLRPLVMNALECSCASRTHVNLVPSHQSQRGATRPTATRCYRFRPNSTIIGCLRHAVHQQSPSRPVSNQLPRCIIVMISAILSDYYFALLLNGFDETSVHFVNIQSAAVYLLIAFLFFFLDVLYCVCYLFASPPHSCKVQN